MNPLSAQALAEFSGEFYKGRPALTRNNLGKGVAYYACAAFGGETLSHFLLALCDGLEIQPPLPDIPNGLQVRKRRASDGSDFLLVSNFASTPLALDLPQAYRDLLADGKPVRGRLEVAPRDVRVLAAM